MDRGMLIFLVCVVLVGMSGVGITQSGYTLSVDDTTDVPDRNIDIEGETFTITEVVQRQRGESVVVETTAPSSDTEYRVRLRNSDLELVQTRAMTGDDTATLSTDCSSCRPGTYVLELVVDGDRKTMKPVVIAGYDVTLEIPDSASEDETVTATVTVEETDLDGQPAAVEVALGNDDGEELRTTATQESDNTYTAEISLNELGTGTYHVFAGAMSDEYVGDSEERELLGLSANRQLEVTDSDSGDSTGDSGGGTSGGSTGGATGGTDATPTPSGNETAAPTETPTETATPTETSTVTPTDAATSSPTETATPTSTSDSDVIAPNESTVTPSEEDGAGFSAIAALVAMTGGIIWWRRTAG
jgi:hypothetical protein